MFCGVNVIAIMRCTVGLRVMSCAFQGSVRVSSVCARGNESLLVELTSIQEPQILFAHWKSSGKDLGKGMMAGGAGEAYASLTTRPNKSR